MPNPKADREGWSMDHSTRVFYVRLFCARTMRDLYVGVAILACAGSRWLSRHRLF